jgi:hypothetical protein
MTLIPSANPRVEIESGDLVVYLKTSEFRSIPYPDQPQLVKAVRRFWCKSKIKSRLLSQVKIRDISTGNELDSAFCSIGD